MISRQNSKTEKGDQTYVPQTRYYVSPFLLLPELRLTKIVPLKRWGIGLCETDHKRELEAVAKMRGLREQGFSYWKIADILNAMKVPTNTRRGRWHARSVQQVLDAHYGRQSLKPIGELTQVLR